MASGKSGFLYATTGDMTKYREVLDSVRSETHIHNLHTTRLLLERLVVGTVEFLGALRLGMPKVNGAQPSVDGTVATTSVASDDDEVDAGSEPPAKEISITASAADLKNPAVIAAMAALRKAGLAADIVEPKYPAASP